MKHTLKITLILTLVFLIAQIVGLSIINANIDQKASGETGQAVFNDLPYDMERPPIEEQSSFLYIMGAILIGTALVFILIHFRKHNLWKIWFLLAVVMTLAIAFSAFISSTIAFILAAVLAVWKVFKPNPLIHNFTEIFIYGGLAVIFVPIMNIFSIFMLLILISIYDMIAVWKSKHMVKMAKFQTNSKVFAGLSIPYEKFKPGKGSIKIEKKVKTAILGGGDIGFPLLFAGVVMKGLIMQNGQVTGFLQSMIIPIVTTIALFILLTKGKEDRFYPAMPFLSMGCFVGYLIVLIL
ncbi:MAG: presenilin family intramembrane aspartyl protease [Nanoarchaeota archaeon]